MSDKSTRLHLLDHAGGGPWPIGSQEGELLDWAGSPEGLRLAVAEGRGGASQLVILPSDGRGAPEVLVTIEVRTQNLEWVPGGEEGGEWARLAVDFDLEASLDFWSDDGATNRRTDLRGP